MIKNQTISLSSSIAKCEGYITSDMDGEKVMLSVQNGKYYNLGEIGGHIWDFIIEEIQVTEIIEYLVSMYDVERNQCEEQVVSFLNNLSEERLIHIL